MRLCVIARLMNAPKPIHDLQLSIVSNRYPKFGASWQTRWSKQVVPRSFHAVSLEICESEGRLLNQNLYVAAVARSRAGGRVGEVVVKGTSGKRELHELERKGEL